MEAIYSSLCPVCRGDLSLSEVETGVCGKKNSKLCEEGDMYENFIRFFKKAIGEPREIQKMWAKRVLNGESFAAVAPTGVGKTSFGTAISLFLAKEGKRCYITLPTTLLVEQVASSIRRYAETLRVRISFNEPGNLKVAYYHGRLKKEEKERFFSIVNDAEILITTAQFLSKHFEDIKGGFFNFIFVDDVDAILKASKNVERVLHLLGFGDSSVKKGCLMVSTATAKKGRKVELFRKLLNFDVGSSFFTVRNIEDIAVDSDSEMEILETILENMGGGGLIFARNSAEMMEIYESLKSKFRIGLASKQTDFERFRSSEVDLLVGVSHYYGSLVRGIDLPEKIRYAVFVGCPVFRIRIDDVEDASKVSDHLISLISLILREKEEIRKLLSEKGFERPDHLDSKRIPELRKTIKGIISRAEPYVSDVVLRESELIIPDVRTYIQASGRTSRLHPGGVTKGVSFVIENDRDVLDAFIRRAGYFDIEISTQSGDLNFERLKNEIDESRKSFGEKRGIDLIKPALFIVESPTKARQISRFFGRPSIRVLEDIIVYEVPTPEYVLLVTASLGHVTDLITNRGFHGVEIFEIPDSPHSHFVPVFTSIKRCTSCGYQFTFEVEKCPRCRGDVSDSGRRIEVLRKLAYETGRVIIGTDPDSEGEKIAWDLSNLLSGCGEIKRAEFHEVTKKALVKALSNLREVDENMVKAQILRRIEDRWIGFVLSRKLQRTFHDRNLSAGRAQTPVLGWILERTKESRRKKVVAWFEDLDLEIESVEEEEVDLEIELISDETVKKSPLPPYTTDTLLRDANRILKLGAVRTMEIAQNLFENGLITYHRTDSTRVSDVGGRIAKDYLGKDFFPREWHAEGAHECIRPTRPLDRNLLRRLVYEGVLRAEGLERIHISLYDLIFRRFMASQCRDFTARIVKYRIRYRDRIFEEERVISAQGRAFDLYKSVELKKELPTGKLSVKAELRRVPKVTPYSEAELVHLMKTRGIGRPSTYATLIERLFSRGYVIERNGRVVGTRKGFVIFDFLSERYQDLISEKRTRILEEKMDKVANGELEYTKALLELYEEIKEVEGV